MSEPSAPAPQQTPEKHKLNHSYIWLGAIRALPYIIIAVIASAGDAFVELFIDPELKGYSFIIIMLGLLLILLVTGIVVLVRFISYKFIWYEYSNDEFSYFSGIISKKRVHVPYQRIQSINQKASLFQRIAGVCTVSIETAGGASNKAVVLPYIAKEAAERLRLDLFERKQIAQMRAAGIDVSNLANTSATNLPSPTGVPVQGIPAPAEVSARPNGAPSTSAANTLPGNALDLPANFANEFRGVFGGEAVDTGTVTYEYGLTNKQLLLSAITGKTSFFVVLISMVAAVASIISSAAVFLGTSEDELFSSIASLIDLIPASWVVGAIASVVGFFISVMAFIWIATVIGTCVSYGGFKARRRGARIETEYGIINHNFSGIDIDRIQSVEISQSFFQRLLKSCTLSLARVTSSAQDSSQDSKVARQSRLVIHPFVKLDKVNGILSNLLPEWGVLPEATQEIPKRALRRAITRRAFLRGGGFWAIIITLFTMWLLALPLEFDAIPLSELEDYVLFYMIAEVVARVIYVMSALVIVLDIIAAILWRSGSGFGYDRSYVTIVNGGFSTDRVITPRVKVQLASIQTNPLQRHKRLTTINALTAAGVGSSTLRLIDVDQEQAQAWFAWCHPGGNRALGEE